MTRIPPEGTQPAQDATAPPTAATPQTLPLEGTQAPPTPVRWDPDALLREYATLTLKNRDLQAAIRKNNDRMNAIKDRCTDEMERRGVPAITFAGLGNLRLKRSAGWAKLVGGTGPDGKYTQEQRDRAAQALILAGLDDLVKVTVNLQSVSARYREWEKQKEHPPPELDGIIEYESDYDLSVKTASDRTKEETE